MLHKLAVLTWREQSTQRRILTLFLSPASETEAVFRSVETKQPEELRAEMLRNGSSYSREMNIIVTP